MIMLKKKSRFLLAIIIAAIFTFVGFGFADIPAENVYAQDAVTEGLDTVGDSSGLVKADLKLTIAKLIRVFLNVLGIIAVILVLYGGFVWMTAGGNDDKVNKAKKILLNAGIGLFIILTSYSITTFVLNSLLNSSGSSSSGSGSDSGSSGATALGGGSVSSFSVSSFSPEGEVSIRNIKLSIVFSRNVDEDTVDGNIIVTNAESGEEVKGTISVKGNKVSFVPEQTCPEPNEDRHCFDENTTYTVKVDN
ncbi:hypothetical protein D6827_04030, partial [Candidatus Parcubacteria bacterium]